MGIVPISSGKDPIFSVAPDKTCFIVLDAMRGNIFTYIMKRDGLDFAEAVEVLAEGLE